MHLIAHDRRQLLESREGGPYRASMSLSGSAISMRNVTWVSALGDRKAQCLQVRPRGRRGGLRFVDFGNHDRLRFNISASQVTSRASFLCMLVLRRQVLLQSAVAIVLSQCS